MLGAVSVPLNGETVTDLSGTRFRLHLNSVPWSSGSRYVSVVSVQGPGDAAPRYWRSTRRASLDYVRSAAGTYAFTVRVKDSQTKRSSGDTAALTFNFGS